MTNSKTHNMIVIALLTALTYVFTRFINIQLPISLTSGGLIHVGNIIIVISAIVFGKKEAALSAGLGMALFDLTSPYAVWAPFTLMIRGAMGYTMGTISHMKNNGSNVFFNIIAIAVSGIICIVGYYFAEVILYGNWITPLMSVPGEITQLLVAFAALPIAMIVKNALKK